MISAEGRKASGSFVTVRPFDIQSIMLVAHLHGGGHVGITNGRKPRRDKKRIPLLIFTCKHSPVRVGEVEVRQVDTTICKIQRSEKKS